MSAFFPDDVQKLTRFSAGIISYTAPAEAGRKLIIFLQSDVAYPIIIDSDLERAAKPR